MQQVPSTALQRLLATLILACVGFVLWLPSAHAARVAVVLSENSEAYQEVYQSFRVRLDATSHTHYIVYAQAASGDALSGAQFVVTVGVRAAEAVVPLPGRTPVLATLVPRAWYLKSGRGALSDGGRREVSAVYVDQPFERYAELIRVALPEARRVGVLLSTEQASLLGELAAALQSHQLTPVSAILPEEGRLVATLEGVLSDADALLAVADPQIFNRNTAQSLFLTTYRYRAPVVGYSRSMTRAGALLSLHASPAQIGQQAADAVIGSLQGNVVRLPAPAYPARFDISVNQKVARSLGVTLTPESELETRMGVRP